MANEIKIHLSTYLKDAGIKASEQQIGKLAKNIARHNKEAASSSSNAWTELVSKFKVIGGVARTAFGAIQNAVRSAFAFEKQTYQFKTLIGNIDEARAHMMDMKELGDTPPFSLNEFASASRQMMVMTDGVLGYRESMNLVGDAAAATGVSLETMGHAVGRLYAFIRDGQPLSRAVMELRNMGVLTPQVAQELQDLQSAGASNADIWERVTQVLGRYKGAMEETEKTGEGLVAAIESQWDNAVRSFGQSCIETSKEGLGSILEEMQRLNEDGTIQLWAKKVSEAISEAVEMVKSLRDSLKEVGDAQKTDVFDRSRGKGDNLAKFLGNAWVGLGAIGAGIRGAFVPGESVLDNYNAHAALNGYGQWADENARALNRRKRAKGEWLEDRDIRDVQEQIYVETKIEAVKAQKAEKQRQNEERAIKEKERISAQMADAQKKNDERAAKEAEAEYEKEYASWMKEQERINNERARLLEQEERDRKQMEERLASARISDLRDYLATAEAEQSAAESRQQSANAGLDKAWGWYRNKESMQAVLDEKKAQAAAEIQWAKDFEKLKAFKRDWRTIDVGKLSAADEAVRQVAFAKEEKAAADKAVLETAENTRELADKLDELLSVK